MLNKFEAIGIGASIVAMAVALYLIRAEENLTGGELATVAGEQPALVVVSRDGEREDELFKTLANSVDANGTVRSLIIDDVVAGTGADVKDGDTVVVHYIGTFQNGQEFDNSNKRGTPFTFTVGRGQVIAGWDKGIIGMKQGGQRILVVPPSLAYGTDGVNGIPGNATLVFAIELLEIN